MNKTTVENKSQLAKLLATENIEVQENAVKTASFDVKDRILTIPIFKEEERSKHIYDMLVGHEVSHALHTPSDGWMNMKDRTQEFRSFVNVIEDARIDKLIQKKYPGLTKDYLLGFKKMYKDNFFGTKDRSLSDYALIDKINLYFKSSKTLDFDFNNKEKHFVKLVDECKTFADVQKLAEDILGYCKEELKKKPQLKKVYQPASSDKDKKEEGDKQDSDSDNSNNKSADEKLKDFLDKRVPDEKQSTPTDKKDSKDSETGSLGNGADGDVKIVSITNQAYDDAIQKQVDDNASSRGYVTLPKVNLKNMIIPYKEYITDFAKNNAKLNNEEKIGLKHAHEEADKFLKESSGVVNYLVKEFEMKKNAQLHARTTISKTGIIDPLKLHSYKFAEDIFKKISSIPNQKNHGMVFLLDWSGSMQRHIMPTTEQLLNLVMFCRKINIPFSVYKFVNNSEFDFGSMRSTGKHNNHPKAPFVLTDKTAQCDQSTRLVQLFTHKQSKSDFKRSAQNIYRSAMYFNGYYDWRNPNHIRVPSIHAKYYMSSTPLNESLIAMDTILAKFKSDYKTDKVALVTLTDGSANSVSTKKGSRMAIKLGNKYHLCEYRWRDEKKDLTHHLLEYLKKKYRLQTIGFFLVKKYNELRYSFHVPYKKEALARSMFNKNKFIPDYSTGYDVYFYVKSDTKVSNQVFEDKNTTNKRYLKKMFMSGMKKRLNSRVLLQNFIKRIA
jgi:hypothetical protein